MHMLAQRIRSHLFAFFFLSFFFFQLLEHTRVTGLTALLVHQTPQGRVEIVTNMDSSLCRKLRTFLLGSQARMMELLRSDAKPPASSGSASQAPADRDVPPPPTGDHVPLANEAPALIPASKLNAVGFDGRSQTSALVLHALGIRSEP